MNHSTRDSHPGTSRATSKDIYPATWTPSAIKSDFEPSRHHRSASGYPSGPDYVSSSRRHGEKSSSARDHRIRNVSEGQSIPPPTSYTRYREPSYADAAHIRSSQRKESAAYTSASKKYPHDSTAYRNNHSAEDVIQYPHITYERWIPPNPPSPPSRQQEPHNRERERDDKDRERDKHKVKEGYHRERREESDIKERHKRRHDEGDSDWDKERERRDRRDRERHREWENDRNKEQERGRAREELTERTREKTAREKARGPERYRGEREQERHTEKERQRAVEKEKGREKERDRERRRQKEREREYDREEGKDKEKPDASRPKIGLDRERRRDRDVALPEREYWPEVEKGRESDREFDRRKKKAEWELQREKEKAREGPERIGDRGDVPVVMQNGRRREVEYEGAKKVQEATRRYQATFPVEGGLIPSVIGEQDIERARRVKKDIDSSRQKEHERIYKASEQSETERACHTDKENVPRRERKSYHERTKLGSRSYADRATDSERENPLHRETGVSNVYQRETVLRHGGSVEPESINLAVKSSIIASKHPRDEKTPYISLVAKTTAPEPVPFSDVPRPTTANDGYMGYTVPGPRLIDQTSLTTPKHSPISAAGAESPKLDASISGVRAKQASSSQRALKRQSKMSYLAPEPVTIFPSPHATYKHVQSHVIVPQPPLSHVSRTEAEDAARLHSTQGPIDSPPNLLPSAVSTKIDARMIAPPTATHRTTSGSQNVNGIRPHGRNANVAVHFSPVQDKANIESPQTISRDARDNAPPDAQMSTRSNEYDAKQKTSALPIKFQADVDDTMIGVDVIHQTASEQVIPRPISRSQVDKLMKRSGHEFDTPIPVPVVVYSTLSTPGATSNATTKSGFKGTIKTSNAIIDPETKVTATERRGLQPGPPAVPFLEAQQGSKREIVPSHRPQGTSDTPLHRPPSAAGWISQQESIKDNVPAASISTGPAAHSAERSVTIEGQLIPNALPACSIRRPTTGFFVSKQEGLFSRVHTKTPIPEIPDVSVANHLPSHVPLETYIQRDTTTPDRRNQPELTAAPPMNSRSISESIGNMTRPQPPKGPGDESIQNRKNDTRSADTDCALSSQRRDSYGHVNVPCSQDQLHLESSQSHSPAASLRHNVPMQLPPNAPSNVVDPIQGPPKSPTANHSRNHSSSAKAEEDTVLTTSHFLPPKLIDDRRGALIPRQSDVGTATTKDSHATVRARNDRTLDAGHYTEREATASSAHNTSANGAVQINQLDSTLSSVFQDRIIKSTIHSHHTEHRRSPKISQQFVDDMAHESESYRKQWKEAVTDKKKQSPVHNNSSDSPLPEAKQEKPSTSHLPEDKMPIILHEGLARILDQPLDKHIKKTRASPSTLSSQNGLPREELRTPANEHDRRQPLCGTPRSMPRSSPSMSHNTPSPIVKTLNHGINLSNAHTNQENNSKETYHRPNASATEYPHCIYRSSSVYPTISTFVSHASHEPSKNPAHSPHSLPVHGPLNSSTIEIIHPTNSSPYPNNSLTSHSLMPTVFNQRSSVVAVKNSDSTSVKLHQPPITQPRVQGVGSHTDIAQLHQSRIIDTSNYQTPDHTNDRPILNETGRTENSSHAQESSPSVTPVASLLFSKAMDHRGSPEQRGSTDSAIAISNHPVRGASNPGSSSPTSQDLERHEPRMITPRIQKQAELSEEPRRKSHSVEVAKSKPLEEGHKKSISLDTSKPKSQEPHQIWYPPASYRDSSYEGKKQSQLTSVTEPVAHKNTPATLTVNDGRGTTGVEQVKPSRRSPNLTNMKVYRYLREKRNRTISAMSMEAQDGTAPSTVVGSPTASVISQAPIYVPSPRDPMKAAQDWLTEGIEAAIRAEAQGRRRILRPGVVFDVAEDPPPEGQRRSKRPRAQSKR